jgi:hypothetical protein
MIWEFACVRFAHSMDEMRHRPPMSLHDGSGTRTDGPPPSRKSALLPSDCPHFLSTTNRLISFLSDIKQGQRGWPSAEAPHASPQVAHAQNAPKQGWAQASEIPQSRGVPMVAGASTSQSYSGEYDGNYDDDTVAQKRPKLE